MMKKLALTGAITLALLPGLFQAIAKKKKPEVTQVLELPKNPPFGVVAETRRLMFNVSPLSPKGLLSQQTRDALKALLRANNGANIVKIRAFVAGTGDMRRVPAIVSETFTEKKMPLPAVSVVQAGGLPLEGAQVVLESVSISKREVNPNGLLLVSGQAATSDRPLDPTLPLAEKSLAGLNRELSGTAGAAGEVLRVTCFSSSLEEIPKIYALVTARYPQAAVDVIEIQRASARSIVECEAVARLSQAHAASLEILNHSQSAAVSAQKVVFTGSQVAFGFDDASARLAFQRLEKALEPLGSSTKNVAMASFYPLSNSIAEQVSRIRLEFFDSAKPPASTLLPFEGLPSMDASFAMDVVAVVNQ